MILKYKVPEQYKRMFKNKETIYCKILTKIKGAEKIYLVGMLNFENKTNVFSRKELKRLNLIDLIKVILKKY